MDDDVARDTIRIHDLHIRCIVGVYPEEREKKQDVIINVTLYADLRKASESDRIEDTLDYKAVKKAIFQLAEQSSFFLIERLAGAVAETCLTWPIVQGVTVTIDKPGALRFARSVSVSITRNKRGNEEEVSE